jgi:hypothetical protein
MYSNLVFWVGILISCHACQSYSQSWSKINKNRDHAEILLLDQSWCPKTLHATAWVDQTWAGRFLISTLEKKHYINDNMKEKLISQNTSHGLRFKAKSLRIDQFSLEDVIFHSDSELITQQSQEQLSKIQPEMIGILSIPAFLEQGIQIEIRLDEGKMIFYPKNSEVIIPMNAIFLGDQINHIPVLWAWLEISKEDQKDQKDQKDQIKFIKHSFKDQVMIDSSNPLNTWSKELISEREQIPFLAHLLFTADQKEYDLGISKDKGLSRKSFKQGLVGLQHFWTGRLYLSEQGIYFLNTHEKNNEIYRSLRLNRFPPYFSCDLDCQAGSYAQKIDQNQMGLSFKIPSPQLPTGLWLKYDLNPKGFPFTILISYQKTNKTELFYPLKIQETMELLKLNLKDNSTTYEINLVDIVRLNASCESDICLMVE